MGIINATPDSFSDGGAFLDPMAARDHGLSLLEGGAEILDVGGESTRPGSLPVPTELELRRVLPVIKALRTSTDAPISIDTSKADVAEACLGEGADIVNDVTALRGDPRMGPVVAESRAGLILMHMQGVPKTMQSDPSYRNDDVVGEVAKFLSERREAALGFGVDAEAIILDPGLGFGKSLKHNLELIRGIPRLIGLDSPLLVGHSRKSFLAMIPYLGTTAGNRLSASVALTGLMRERGARIFRVHEATPHCDSLRATEGVLSS